MLVQVFEFVLDFLIDEFLLIEKCNEFQYNIMNGLDKDGPKKHIIITDAWPVASFFHQPGSFPGGMPGRFTRSQVPCGRVGR